MQFSDDKVLSKRKQEILDRAQELFNRKGYVSASMRDLAEELSIKPASLYSHYASKEEILWAIAVRCAREFYEGVLPIAERDMTPDKRLEKMIDAHISVIIRNIDAAGIFFKEWKKLNEPKRTEYAKLILGYEAAFAQVIQEGISDGIFQDIPPKFTSSMLLAAINWIQYWYKPTGNMKEEDISAVCKAFILNGLMKH